ncbi:MAG: dihydrofolate reductase [Acholeplasmataceae bacterium]|nr:dihydrofolate reductase [Acholeplasmataceae bacterium]
MISIIVAIAKNNVIGNSNTMPWYYPEDLKYFRELTTGKTILMGRRTFDSILARNGKPLPMRKHIVVTRNPDFSYPGVEVINDLSEFLKEKREEEVFVIGGGEIYHSALPYAQRLYITHIDHAYPGDVYFPEIDYDKYNLLAKRTSSELTFAIYERIE